MKLFCFDCGDVYTTTFIGQNSKNTFRNDDYYSIYIISQ